MSSKSEPAARRTASRRRRSPGGERRDGVRRPFQVGPAADGVRIAGPPADQRHHRAADGLPLARSADQSTGSPIAWKRSTRSSPARGRIIAAPRFSRSAANAERRRNSRMRNWRRRFPTGPSACAFTPKNRSSKSAASARTARRSYSNPSALKLACRPRPITR